MDACDLIRQRASAHTWSLERRHDLVDPVKHARFVDHLERGLALTSHDRVIRHLPPAVGSATVKRGQDHCGANMHAMGLQHVCERECMCDNRTWARARSHTRKGAQWPMAFGTRDQDQSECNTTPGMSCMLMNTQPSTTDRTQHKQS
jgi:hypothetical protein